MKKYFVMSDIHSFCSFMEKALEDAGFDVNNPDHIVIICGDLFDRGFESTQCLNFVMKTLPKDRRILIRGNHEDLLEECLKYGCFGEHDYHNKTDKTIWHLSNDFFDNYAESLGYTEDEKNNMSIFDACKKHPVLQEYLNECKNYAEIGDKIFVHSWVPVALDSDDKPIVQENWQNGTWDRARWGNPFVQWKRGLTIPGKTIYCGHWHTSWAHHYYHNDGEEFGKNGNFGPFVDEGIVGLDACTVYSGKVNCVIFEEE